MNRYFKLIFLLLCFFYALVWGKNTKVKIYQTACIDLKEILTLVEEDEDFKNSLEQYQEEQLSKADEIKRAITDLENYLQENLDFSANKKKEIINDIEFQRSLLSLIYGKNDPDGVYDEDDYFFIMLYQIVEQIAKREGFSLVVEKQSAVVYFDEEVDLTDRVISEIKNRLK